LLAKAHLLHLYQRLPLLHALASLRLTLWLLPLLLLFVTAFLLNPESPAIWLMLPLVLLSLNLLAAILTHAAFRREPPLLTFHLALLVLVVLAALGRLTHFNGQAEVTVGESFDESIVVRQGGIWHNDRLAQLNFHLDSFAIDYVPLDGVAQRGATRAKVSWLDDQGNEHEGVVGDHRPLVLAGYRFYTTHNKGFAPVFIWKSTDELAQQGSIHLPAWPTHEFQQALDWNIPGTAHRLWTELLFDEVILDPRHPSQFRPPSAHSLVVRAGDARHELQPGQWLDFPDGRLTYKELRTWMGFTVYYDWTLPWLFSAGLLAVLSLGWYYWRRYATKPWSAMDELVNEREQV
jgi:cytochrome c biogenesis protein ResB